MDEGDRKEIEEIMAGITCPKDFKCAESGFEELCRARNVGLESFLECRDEDPETCSFSTQFGFGHFCQCPVRVHLAKKLNI
jgi:hypothetical protein